MKTLHTPGPWEVSKTDFDTKHEGGGYSINTLEDKDYQVWHIATVEDIDELQNEANARLIAAAPELLEALHELANQAEANNDYDCDTQLQNAVENARTIITKATGGDK